MFFSPQHMRFTIHVSHRRREGNLGLFASQHPRLKSGVRRHARARRGGSYVLGSAPSNCKSGEEAATHLRICRLQDLIHGHRRPVSQERRQGIKAVTCQSYERAAKRAPSCSRRAQLAAAHGPRGGGAAALMISHIPLPPSIIHFDPESTQLSLQRIGSLEVARFLGSEPATQQGVNFITA